MAHILTLNNINPNLVKIEYALRGSIPIRAAELERDLKKGVKKNFDQIIMANLGDPQALGDKPMTFTRQLFTLVLQPTLIDILDYPSDVKERAIDLLKDCKGGSVGSYTDSLGLEIVRRQVAEYLHKRDKHYCDYKNIVLTAGATSAIKLTLELLSCTTEDGKKTGIMIPIPQYPLYSATIAEYGMQQIGYYLDEDDNWSLNIDEIKRAFQDQKEHIVVRGIVVINPGNPTGQVLRRENIAEIIKFAFENNLIILADEVYQDNINDEAKFFSFKKIIRLLGPPYNETECVSFVSASKSYLGECGIRGGCMEIINFDSNVQSIFTKLITTNLCATTLGQVLISSLVNPPIYGQASYENFKKERDERLYHFKERAEYVYNNLSNLDGFHMNRIQGSIFAFPRIDFPRKAIEAAKAAGKAPDVVFCIELLEATGICAIPGSGFGQKPGTYHLRTNLPPMDKLKVMVEKIKHFHSDFCKRYS